MRPEKNEPYRQLETLILGMLRHRPVHLLVGSLSKDASFVGKHTNSLMREVSEIPVFGVFLIDTR